MHVKLGNHAPLDRDTQLEGWAVTDVSIPDNYTLLEAVSAVTAADGVWKHHSADEAPAWVWSDNESLQTLLAESFKCEVGVPADVEDKYYTSTPPGVHPEEN